MAATITSTATRITVSGTYKAFTGGNGSTTTVIQYSSGEAPAAGDAGRFLLWKQTVGETGTWQIRYIVSATATTVTVGDGGFSSAPPNGASFVISTNLADIKTAVSSSVAVNGNQYSFGARDWSLTSGAFLADVNKSLYMESAVTPGWPLAPGTAIQFGRLNGGEANGSKETTEGCHLVFNSKVASQSVYSSTNDRVADGAVTNYYGCLVESFTLSDPEWSFQRMTGPARFIGTVFDGPMGGRFYHEASEWVDCRFSGNRDSVPAWSLGATFTRDIENVSFFDGLVAIKNYNNGATVFGGTLRNTTFSLTSLTAVFAYGTAVNPAGVFDFVDCTTFDETYIVQTGTSPRYGIVNQKKSVNYQVADSAGAALSNVLVAVYDNTSTIQDSIKTSDGSGVVAQIEARFFNWNNGSVTSYTPFVIRTRKYGYVFQEISSNISDPIRQQNRLVANVATVLSEAAAAALTGIAIDFSGSTVTVTSAHTLSEIYDYCQSQLALSANMNRAEFLTTTTGNVFTFAANWQLILGTGGSITSATGKTVEFSGTGRLQINGASATFTGLTVTGNVVSSVLLSAAVTGVSVSGSFTFGVAGSYTLSESTLNEVINTSGGNVTLVGTNGTTVATNTGPNITIEFPVTLFFSVSDVDGNPVQNARVYVKANGGGPETPGTVLVNALTDVNGEVSVSYNFIGPQPVVGWVRKATNSPFYQQASLAGTVDSDGYSASPVLISDE